MKCMSLGEPRTLRSATRVSMCSGTSSSCQHSLEVTVVSQSLPRVRRLACRNVPTTTYESPLFHQQRHSPEPFSSTAYLGEYSGCIAPLHRATGFCESTATSSARCIPKAAASTSPRRRRRAGPDQEKKMWGQGVKCEGNLRLILQPRRKA
jgi:hypothetical protein